MSADFLPCTDPETRDLIARIMQQMPSDPSKLPLAKDQVGPSEQDQGIEQPVEDRPA